MADRYSDLFSDSVSALPQAQYQAPLGADGGVVRYKRAAIRLNASFFENLDVLRLMKFSWQDRLLSFYLTVQDVSDLNFNIDIGLWECGNRHSGDFHTPNAFAQNLDPSVSFTDGVRQDIFGQYNPISHETWERGLTLWEIAQLTEDPLGEIEIAARIEGTPVSNVRTTWEVYYIANS